MENYKHKLKKQNIVIAICIVVLLLVFLLGLAAEAELIALTPSTGDSHWHAKWRGFMRGAAAGALGSLIFALIRNRNALKDEKKLKKLYIQTHDERLALLFHNARSTAMTIFLIVGILAVIVTGYFSVTVSITILACILFCCILCLFLKIYYSKKY